MKKLVALVFLLCMPVVVSATSGACSSHDGVNCRLKTASGFAICHDGEISSVRYDDMEECSASCWITREEQISLDSRLNQLTEENLKWAQDNLNQVLNAVNTGQDIPDQTAAKAIAQIHEDVVDALKSQADCAVYPTVLPDPAPIQLPELTPKPLPELTPIPPVMHQTAQAELPKKPKNIVKPITLDMPKEFPSPAPKQEPSLWERITNFFRKLF